MKSKILALALALAAVPATSAFSLNEVKPDFDAYVSLLNDKGYVVRSYDISQLADTTYMLGLIVREYDGGKMIHDGSERFNYMIRNRLMASGFSESARASLDPAEMADPEKGIVTLGSRINIGLSPPQRLHPPRKHGDSRDRRLLPAAGAPAPDPSRNRADSA